MKTIKTLCIVALILGIASVGWTEEMDRIATIAKINGAAEVKTASGVWKPAEAGMVLAQGDEIRTKANSSAVLNLDGKAQTATVEVKENSDLKLAKLIESKKEASQSTLLDLSLGKVLINAKKLHSEKSKFEVKTPTSIVAVRGTTFSVSVETVD